MADSRLAAMDASFVAASRSALRYQFFYWKVDGAYAAEFVDEAACIKWAVLVLTVQVFSRFDLTKSSN